MADVQRVVVSRHGLGSRLPQSLLKRLQPALDADLTSVRVHSDSTAARLTEILGAAAFAAGDDIYFRPGLYSPESPLGFFLLCHELAHVIQQRGTFQRRLIIGVDDGGIELEREANAAAFALLRGLQRQVLPQPGCPYIQCNPLVILAILAGLAVWLWPSTTDTDANEEAVPELYETGWGFLPFVGSLDQMINGKNYVQQLAGGAFFVLDLWTAGGGAAMRNSVRGMALKLKPEVQAALKKASQAGANPAHRKLWSKLLFGHQAKFGTEATIKELFDQLVNKSTGGVLLVGTQTGKEGVHHSVVYLIHDGTIVKLHGGITNLAGRVTRKPSATIVTEKWLKEFNTLSVYGPTELATVGMKDADLLRLVDEWGSLSTGFKAQVLNRVCSRGCAYSQALLLERTGILQTSGVKQYVPLLLDRARMSKGLGAHYVIRPDRAVLGTGAHALAPAAGLGVYGAAKDFTGVGPWHLFNPFFNETIVAQPVTEWSLDPEVHPFPDGGSFSASYDELATSGARR